MIRRLFTAIGDKLIGTDASGLRKCPMPTDVLPQRTPGAALDAAVVPYLDGRDLYPDDELTLASVTPLVDYWPAEPSPLLPTPSASVAYDPRTGALVHPATNGGAR